MAENARNCFYVLYEKEQGTRSRWKAEVINEEGEHHEHHARDDR